MTTEERVQAVVDFGFTERQARFLVLVMRHAGVCVPRQYARFAGVAYGAKCNAFFERLVRRGYAVASDCIHNRARLYHLHHRPLYHVIGEVTSRYRRRVPPRLAVERLMLLDAVLTTSDLDWLTTASDKGAYLARQAACPGTEPPHDTAGDAPSRPVPQLTAMFPIGLEPDAPYSCTWPLSPGRTAFEASSRDMRRCCVSRRPGRYGSCVRARSTASTMRIRPSSARSWSPRSTP